jgi:hypothetical protein
LDDGDIIEHGSDIGYISGVVAQTLDYQGAGKFVA